MSRNMHKYEELTPYEFDQEKNRASIIYVGSGPLEYHEEANAMGLDLLKGYQWCLDAAEITGGIVFPPLPVSPNWFWPLNDWETIRRRWKKVKFGEYTRMPLLYPGIMFSRETSELVYRELMESFAFIGFKLCVFIGSHGPSGQMIKNIIARENGLCGEDELPGPDFGGGKFHGMEVMSVGSLDFSGDLVREFNKEHNIAQINHGGLWESAYNYAINPDYYHPEYLDEKKYFQHYGVLPEEHFTEGGPVDDPEQEFLPDSLKNNTACMRPAKSEFRKFSADFAEKLQKTTVTRLAEAVLRKYESLRGN